MISCFSLSYRLPALLSTFIAALFLIPNARAEIWRCGERSYTNVPNARSNCAPLRSALVCGNEGNKYFTPWRPGLKSVHADTCDKAEGGSPSPFVNSALIERYGKMPISYAPTKPFRAPNHGDFSVINAADFESLYGKTGLDLKQIQGLVQSFNSLSW